MGKEIVVGWDGFWKEKLEVQFYGLPNLVLGQCFSDLYLWIHLAW